MAKQKLTVAVLVNIVTAKGYLVFRVPSLPGESVTVSRKNWIDTDQPCIGTDVVLIGNLIHHRNGWRANAARYLRPEDSIDDERARRKS